MMTMRPSPRIVAPAMPRMAAICGPTDFTTISRLPTSSSHALFGDAALSLNVNISPSTTMRFF